MLPPMQTVEDLRSVCRALPHSLETFPFDDVTLVFKVGYLSKSKMYALTDVTADPLRLSVKVPPERGEELRAEHPGHIVPGHHLNKRHWVTLTLDGSLPAELVKELLRGSYLLVARGGFTKAERRELGLPDAL
ncbi:Predicted DNA-binding protein, MmcQ/YjbR family [Deinococcus reticulitermitis]|uniref:Predicted DNA-binding protein, MmcQ/YjbR family n=2 Tax=Deinococcus reticulitermitis TaxID=856736 RepID=A0A1H7A1P2_9DEIO|nr:Predicted DNA-binding protein, MmcQ/YjbR family [Deinococcus reticulitermitis]